jgi:hypothetical protein
MNYGPRFQPTIGNINKIPFYEENYWERRGRQRMAAIYHHMPQHKKELMAYNGGVTRAKIVAKKTGMAKAEREEAERLMVDAIRQAVAMLEFNMTALMQHPKPTVNYYSSVNQEQCINAILLLKTKCGVTFDSKDFTQRVVLDRDHVSKENSFEKMEMQREDRLEREAKMARLDLIREVARKRNGQPR